MKKIKELIFKFYILNKYKYNWDRISQHQKLSEDFIREFQDKVDWNYISIYQKLSENFIREFQDKVNWYLISLNQILSENFIREFRYKVSWDWISEKQNLSENFIREFKDKVYWYLISSDQKLSENFIREFKDKVYWVYISKNPNIEFSPNFLIDLYLNYDEIIFNLIKKNKPELNKLLAEIEQQIPKLFLEVQFNDRKTPNYIKSKSPCNKGL